MKHVKHIKTLLSELHAKKHKGHIIKEEEKIKHIIEKELHNAQIRHNKAIRNYVIFFSFALLLLTTIYIFNPNLPMYVIALNILIAVTVFAVGIFFLSSGYKREIKDYITIEEHLDDLKK